VLGKKNINEDNIERLNGLEVNSTINKINAPIKLINDPLI
jgi:hypothetical protein